MALEIARAASQQAATPAPSRRRSHAVADAVQKEIVLGALSPGEPLLELALAKRFACSQSTVREALLRLEQDGLVDRLAHRRTTVALCGAGDARMLLEIRHTIECQAIARAVARASAALERALGAEIDAMRAAAQEGDEYALSVHDRRFHLTLFEAADLPAVHPILGRCLIHNHRYKILNSQPNRSLAETAERHVAILDTIRARDAAAARRALSHHVATIVDLGPAILCSDALTEETP